VKEIKHNVDLCVVGGGLAGICTAISAARSGIKVILMQDRPVLGGNASSEVRMWICGAHGEDNRETGIVEEIILENFYRNKELNYNIWDSVLYEKVKFQPNIELLLNCTCIEAETENNKIKSIKGWQMTSETYHVVEAKYFADCSGDSILAPLTGAEFMLGREGKNEFNESIAPDVADKRTMGMSCLIQLRELAQKQEFVPPDWAYKYLTDDDLPGKNHIIGPRNNFWWLELGGTKDSIHDTEELRDELLKIAFGVWDHMKNHGDHGADNWQLDWIGFLPGKRESRRYKGEHIITQNDVEAGGKFDDVVAYGGWSMDDHFPEGFYYNGTPTTFHPAPSPWGIPFRSLYSKNIKNLVFAGRNISATHVAMSSSRVMGTCGIIGQAVGTAVANAVKEGVPVQKIDIKELQRMLVEEDCMIPGIRREVSEISKNATVSAEIVRNGIDRGEENCWVGKSGEYIEYKFDSPKNISGIRLVFDSDINREYKNMPCIYPLVETEFKLPQTLIREYEIVITDSFGNEHTICEENNRKRFVKHTAEYEAVTVRLSPRKTWGSDVYRVFCFEVY